MSKRKIILATLLSLLILVGVVAFNLWAGEEILPGDPPTAVATASPAAVAVGKTVTLDGSGSKDKDIKATWVDINGEKYDCVEVEIDGKVKKWKWKFGDGTTGSGKKVTHKYTQAGKYTVTLKITADHDETASTTVPVTVNTPPTVSITSPSAGEKFTVGDQIACTGTATDAEDGDLTDQIQWAPPPPIDTTGLNPQVTGVTVNGEDTIIRSSFPVTETYTADLQGPITSLSITASVTDSLGASVSDNVNVSLVPSNIEYVWCVSEGSISGDGSSAEVSIEFPIPSFIIYWSTVTVVVSGEDIFCSDALLVEVCFLITI